MTDHSVVHSFALSFIYMEKMIGGGWVVMDSYVKLNVNKRRNVEG